VSKELDARKILAARGAALRSRLIGDGLLPDQADRWIEAWSRTGRAPESAAYWEQGYEWIAAQTGRRA